MFILSKKLSLILFLLSIVFLLCILFFLSLDLIILSFVYLQLICSFSRSLSCQVWLLTWYPSNFLIYEIIDINFPLRTTFATSHMNLTGRPGVLRFMGLQRVGYDWVTELNWTEHEFEYAPGVGDGQGSVCVYVVTKSQTQLSD